MDPPNALSWSAECLPCGDCNSPRIRSSAADKPTKGESGRIKRRFSAPDCPRRFSNSVITAGNCPRIASSRRCISKNIANCFCNDWANSDCDDCRPNRRRSASAVVAGSKKSVLVNFAFTSAATFSTLESVAGFTGTEAGSVSSVIAAKSAAATKARPTDSSRDRNTICRTAVASLMSHHHIDHP